MREGRARLFYGWWIVLAGSVVIVYGMGVSGYWGTGLCTSPESWRDTNPR